MGRIGWTLAALLLTACASAPLGPFDPRGDRRFGEEVDEICRSGLTSSSGGYIDLGKRDGFLISAGATDYVLVFSRGCGDLGPAGAFPVFRNFGDNCRRKGELVQTARDGFRLSGGCTIDHIYEWDANAALE
ncbi:MAG: DUF6491 family protein [Pseudomonadota bacterium]